MEHVDEIAQMMEEVGGAWTPASLPETRHWLDGSDINTMWKTTARTILSGAGDPVGSWYDKVAGIYWEQGNNDAWRPVANAGRTGLTYDGVDRLSVAKSNVAWMTGAGVDHRIFAVVNPTSVAGTMNLWGVGFSAFGVLFRMVSNKLQAGAGDGGGGTFTLKDSTANITAVNQLSEQFFDNTNDLLSPIINDGVKTDTAAAAYDLGFNVNDLICSVGATGQVAASTPFWGFSGDIQEIVVTEGISDADRDLLVAYLSDKHSLGL